MFSSSPPLLQAWWCLEGEQSLYDLPLDSPPPYIGDEFGKDTEAVTYIQGHIVTLLNTLDKKSVKFWAVSYDLGWGQRNSSIVVFLDSIPTAAPMQAVPDTVHLCGWSGLMPV